jgi:hypothetical protein
MDGINHDKELNKTLHCLWAYILLKEGEGGFVKRGGLKKHIFKITYLFSQNTQVITRLKISEFSSQDKFLTFF